jgi:glycosyltransferase involved in cell wall biosynthesis
MKKKPRILVLYDFPIKGGGSGIYVKYLALRLREVYKYDIAIAAPDDPATDVGVKFFPIKLPQVPVFIGRPGLEGAKKYSQLSGKEIAELYDAFISETARIVEEFKPDIIHVHHIMVNSWAARFIRSVYGTKFIMTSHGSCLYAISEDRRYLRMTRDALRGASAITVVSGDIRAKLFRLFGSDIADKTRTIPGGVRLSAFPDKKNPAELKAIAEKYKIPSGKIVLFTGRLINEKGVQYLIKAAKKIQGQILIVGDGARKDAWIEMVAQNNIKNVTILGYVNHEDLISLYYLAHVFVSPAIWNDPMPLTVMEAMAAGLPVVVTKRGGVPIAVKDGYNGFFVRVRNVEDIVEKVNLLLNDDNLKKKMGERGRAIVKVKFTWTKIAERMHKLYSTI